MLPNYPIASSEQRRFLIGNAIYWPCRYCDKPSPKTVCKQHQELVERLQNKEYRKIARKMLESYND